jgi:protein-S-isoprenylcysteine O-methyltransferase Ste14
MSIKEICWNVVLTALCIACFPANPIVLTGLVDTEFYLPLFVIGCIFWAAGMVLVIAPIVMFPRHGGVAKGKSFVHTTRLVDTGIYSLVRHPQYLGGVLALFVTTVLWYPHWLFVVLGIAGVAVLYASTIMEEKRLIEQFGDEYLDYMKRVPRMNIILGIVRRLRQRPGRAEVS